MKNGKQTFSWRLIVLVSLLVAIVVVAAACAPQSNPVDPIPDDSVDSGNKEPVSPENCTHEETEWVLDVNPTCIREGKQHKVCVLCKTTFESEVLPMVAHTKVTLPKVEATYEETGLKLHMKRPV